MGEFLKEKPLFNVVDRNAENIFWVDQYISGVVGVDAIYESKRIVESDLPNFGNYDTIFTGNRSQDTNGNSFQLINGKTFLFSSAVAPTIGDASFEFYGYGTTVSDILFRVKNGAGSERVKVRANGDVYFSGEEFNIYPADFSGYQASLNLKGSGASKIGFGNNTNYGGYIYVNSGQMEINSAGFIMQTIKSGLTSFNNLGGGSTTTAYEDTGVGTANFLIAFKKANGEKYTVSLPAIYVP